MKGDVDSDKRPVPRSFTSYERGKASLNLEPYIPESRVTIDYAFSPEDEDLIVDDIYLDLLPSFGLNEILSDEKWLEVIEACLEDYAQGGTK
jgi:hypothetical protein